MSSICGNFSRSGKPVSPEAIGAMIATLGHWQRDGDRTGAWLDAFGTVALGHVMLTNTPESLDETLPFHHSAAGLTITADARIDNREDLCCLLEIPAEERKTIPDSRLILESYRKWGRECVTRLLGDFAFAVWDDREKQLFCARDHLGAKPLFYHAADDVFIFATEMKGIFSAKNLSREVDQLWIADLLTVLVADNEYTPYQEIRRLPPAHWLSVSAGEIHKQCYWQPDPDKEIRLPSEKVYVEAFRELLTEAVRCRVRSAFPVGAELSGGLDSSPVAAMAVRQAEARNVKFTTFSHVLGEGKGTGTGSKTDDRELQEMLRRHARIAHAHNLADHGRGVLEPLRESLRVHDGPGNRTYGFFTDILHETAAREGVRTLLSGFGGDQVVSQPAGSYMNELAHRREWRRLWQEYRQCAGPGEKIPFKSILGKMVEAYAPLWKSACTSVRKRLRKGEGTSVRHLSSFPIDPEFYRAARVRRRLAAIPRPSNGRDVRSTQYLRITGTNMPIQLEHCSIEAAAHRLEYRYPLLDIRLLEFHLAVPSHLKRKNGCGRYLFRKAIEGIVPPEIQWQDKSKVPAIPAIHHRLIRDAREIESLIRRAKNGDAARYINLEQMGERLERLVKMEANDGPMQFGVFLNALKLMLHFESGTDGNCTQ